MNIATCQAYFKKVNSEKFGNIIDFNNVSFELSKDEGICMNMKNGKYTIGIGRTVTQDKANRVLTVIYMDLTLKVLNENERLEKGYTEFATAVAKQKYKFFKPEFVWYEKDGKLIKDVLMEEYKTNCLLKKAGKIDKKYIYGLFPREYRFVKKPAGKKNEEETHSNHEDEQSDVHQEEK